MCHEKCIAYHENRNLILLLPSLRNILSPILIKNRAFWGKLCIILYNPLLQRFLENNRVVLKRRNIIPIVRRIPISEKYPIFFQRFVTLSKIIKPIRIRFLQFSRTSPLLQILFNILRIPKSVCCLLNILEFRLKRDIP